MVSHDFDDCKTCIMKHTIYIRCTCTYYIIWGFPEMGVPLVIIHILLVFSLRKTINFRAAPGAAHLKSFQQAMIQRSLWWKNIRSNMYIILYYTSSLHIYIYHDIISFLVKEEFHFAINLLLWWIVVKKTYSQDNLKHPQLTPLVKKPRYCDLKSHLETRPLNLT